MVAAMPPASIHMVDVFQLISARVDGLVKIEPGLAPNQHLLESQMLEMRLAMPNLLVAQLVNEAR